MKSSRVRITLAGFSLLVLPLVMFAQPTTAPNDQAFYQRVMDRQMRVQAISSDRTAVVDALMSKWSGEMVESEFASILAAVSPEKLLELEAAESAADLNAILYGSSRPSGSISPMSAAVLGSNATDLVYFPVTPCRIVSTVVTGSPLAANVIYSYDSQGPFTAQGGDAGTCGLPGSDTAALAVVLIAVIPSGPGNLRAWPAGDPVPLSSVINYNNPTIANTHILPLQQDALNANEFSVRADVSSTHFIADVVGYFWSPVATALDTQVLQTTEAVAASAIFTIFSPACPAGWRLTGGGHIAQNFGAPVSIATSHPNLSGVNVANQWIYQGTNSVTAQNHTSVVICGRVPGR
ncbi:MAG: hypothetical protein M3542_00990 [Acidobacteriota bacterium]|nr:hypothetical protein [Acidobacteriota bacterium]